MSAIAAPSPKDYVRSLSSEDREAVLETLLEEVYLNNGQGLVSLTSTSGKSLGYLVPPEVAGAQWQRLIESMPESIREKMTRDYPPDFDPDKCLSEGRLEELRQSAFARFE